MGATVGAACVGAGAGDTLTFGSGTEELARCVVVAAGRDCTDGFGFELVVAAGEGSGRGAEGGAGDFDVVTGFRSGAGREVLVAVALGGGGVSASATGHT